MRKRTKQFAAMLLIYTMALIGCSANNSTDNSKLFDLAAYTDTYWATEGIDYTTGGYVLGIDADKSNDTAYFSLDLVQAYPGERTATISLETKSFQR